MYERWYYEPTQTNRGSPMQQIDEMFSNAIMSRSGMYVMATAIIGLAFGQFFVV